MMNWDKEFGKPEVVQGIYHYLGFHLGLDKNEPRDVLYFKYFMKNLELSNDMRVFDEMYHILSTQSVSGRLMIELVRQESKKNALIDSSYKIIKGYNANPFLKKKWNA